MVWRCAWEKCVEKIIPEIGGGQWRTMGLSLGTPFLFLYLLWPTLLFGTIFLPITLDIIDGPKTYIIYFYWCTGLLKAIRKIKIPLKFTDLQDGVDKHVVEQWPVLDPHSIFAFLTEHAGLTIPSASLKEYWEFNSRHGEPWAQGVPTDTMPLGLYGDGARVHTKFGSTNLIGIYFNLPLWKPQSVRASRFFGNSDSRREGLEPSHNECHSQTCNMEHQQLNWWSAPFPGASWGAATTGFECTGQPTLLV